ncbi:uncharacterized protein LOC127239244 [Andrographis paniculata]|uniref:uncharacterized protein LOC127239244 n=1 Tax=Andrographis paniculata TaxID=175694 RepID=UPI0021E8C7A3|nr:uncharacterized protein LOC127239244 [Andrographis paniculata]
MAHDRGSLAANSPAAFGQKLCKDPTTNKTAQATVTCVYRARIAGFWRNVTALWGKNLMNNTLSLSIDAVDNAATAAAAAAVVYTCKIDLKPWHFWTKKGSKAIEIDDGSIVDVHWNLRSARFSGSCPEPCSDYYVAIVSDDEVVLLLGDYKKKAYKRTKASPTLVDAKLYYKKENLFGKRSFSTRARFNGRKPEHEIVVESSAWGPNDPEMWISVDGAVVVHVTNLQWKFRGNETVVVDEETVRVFWDVHAWLFCAPGTSYGLFIFRSGDGGGGGGDGGGWEEDSLGFCLYLYAWRIE